MEEHLLCLCQFTTGYVGSEVPIFLLILQICVKTINPSNDTIHEQIVESDLEIQEKEICEGYYIEFEFWFDFRVLSMEFYLTNAQEIGLTSNSLPTTYQF